MSEDFGGDAPEQTPAQKRAAERRAKFMRDECRECWRPVTTKRNGQKHTLCVDHAKADRVRKGQ